MAFAQHDATAALRVAQLCGLDLLNDFPRLIIENCDQPAFLIAILQLASEQPLLAIKWAVPIAEAGIRSSIVAESLYYYTDLDLWADHAKRVFKEYRWFDNYGLKRTPYTHCLSTACAHFDVNNSDLFPMVMCLKSIKSPGMYRHYRTVVAIGYGMFVIALSIAVLLLFFMGSSKLLVFIWLVLGVSPILPALSLIVRTVQRRKLYTAMLSLSPQTDRLSGALLLALGFLVNSIELDATRTLILFTLPKRDHGPAQRLFQLKRV
jgi:hypothetical protein